MHIVFYTPHWKKGGIERVIKYIVDGLSGDGTYKFSIVTEDVPNPAEQFEFSSSTDIYFRNYSPFSPANLEAMKDLFLRLNPDAVCVMASNRTMYRPSRALVGTDIPIIVSEHNAAEQIVKRFNGEKRFLNAVRNLADFNHVLFADYAKDYKSGSKVRVINNPVIPSNGVINARSVSGERNKIVNVSRYDLHQKQQDILIKSFASIAAQHPSWDLELHGGDWFGGKGKLKKLVAELGVSDRVFLFDSTDRVGEVLSGAKIFAFPSAYEGSPLALGEALAHGLPVVGFRGCAGVNQMIEDGENGLLVGKSVRDVQGYAAGLSRMMSDEELRVSMSAKAAASIENHRLDAFIEAWDGLFKDAFKKKGHNVLRNCTDMEIDYIDLVASGTLFDHIGRLNKPAKEMARIDNFLKRHKLMKVVADRIFKWM